MGIYSIAEMLGVDAATTSWKMAIGKKKPGEDFVPGPGVNPTGAGGGGVGGEVSVGDSPSMVDSSASSSSTTGVQGLFSDGIDQNPVPRSSAPPPPPPKVSQADGQKDDGLPPEKGRADQQDKPRDNFARQMEPAEPDKIMTSTLSEETRKALGDLHKSLEAARYQSHLGPRNAASGSSGWAGFGGGGGAGAGGAA